MLVFKDIEICYPFDFWNRVPSLGDAVKERARFARYQEFPRARTAGRSDISKKDFILWKRWQNRGTQNS